MRTEFVRRFIALLRKEVRQMLRDKSNLAVGLLLPIADSAVRLWPVI